VADLKSQNNKIMRTDLEARPRAKDTILLGGLAIGVLDFFDAILWGSLGTEAARTGDWNTAPVGIALHFVLAFSIATVYYFAARNISFLIRHPGISGLLFGVPAHLFMKYIVSPVSGVGTVSSLIGHALLVGLPVALTAAWSAQRSRVS
jgi:hypothetical protein